MKTADEKLIKSSDEQLEVQNNRYQDVIKHLGEVSQLEPWRQYEPTRALIEKLSNELLDRLGYDAERCGLFFKAIDTLEADNRGVTINFYGSIVVPLNDYSAECREEKYLMRLRITPNKLQIRKESTGQS